MLAHSAAPTVIVGGGLAGISAALHLRGSYWLFERDATLGGLARTSEREGFRFDRTGHWLHLRHPEMRDLADRAMGAELAEISRKARVHFGGALVRYPFQANLHGLPPEVVHECLMGVIRAHRGREEGGEPRTFKDYVLHHFGEGIARHFMVPYNRKLWGVPLDQISSGWCQRFVPRPNLEQIVAGAVGAGPPEMGYNVKFLYPRRGGIQAFSDALAAGIDPSLVRLNAPVEGILPGERKVRVAGELIPYRSLIASLPLPKLVAMAVGAPPEVLEAAARLRATSLRYFNIAVRGEAASDYHWVYVPDEDLPFYRVGVFSNVMPSMAPSGCASLYVELAEREASADTQALARDVISGLVRVKAIGSASQVLFADLQQIDPAYVIFDDHYERSVKTIHAYLESQGIFAIGRYGAWIYNAMEDSLLAGRAAAERVNQAEGHAE